MFFIFAMQIYIYNTIKFVAPTVRVLIKNIGLPNLLLHKVNYVVIIKIKQIQIISILFNAKHLIKIMYKIVQFIYIQIS